MVSIIGYSIGEIVGVMLAMYVISLVLVMAIVFMMVNRREWYKGLGLVITVIFFMGVLQFGDARIGWVMFYNGAALIAFLFMAVMGVAAYRQDGSARQSHPMEPAYNQYPQQQYQQPVLQQPQQGWQRPPWMK